MRVFIYEYLTAGGLLNGGDAPPPATMLREGRAMVHALASDFAAIDGCEPQVMWDSRLSEVTLPNCRIASVSSIQQQRDTFQQLASAADWTVVIAPEMAGILSAHVEQVLASGGRLLGPSPEFVRLASNKILTVERLRAAQVPVPHAIPLAPRAALPLDFPYPAVLKPCDGAGSTDVRLVASSRAARAADADGASWQLEQYHPGLAASVALLCGPREVVPLPACRQLLSGDGRFRYLGAELPLAEQLVERAVRLARATMKAFPAACGYVGIDMVLGEDREGNQDVVIEVNPRLTTSYVVLRRVAHSNLAQAMLQVALGEPYQLSFDDTPSDFRIDAL